jgi:hypothetical protein
MLRFLAATITSGSSAVLLPSAAAAVALLLLLLLGSIKKGAKRCRLLARSAVASSKCTANMIAQVIQRLIYISSSCSNFDGSSHTDVT